MKGGQRFICSKDHGPFLPSELHKARRTEDGLVPFTVEELAAVADEMPVGIFEMNVCERAELEEHTRRADNAYRLRLPTKSGTKKLSAKTLEMLAGQYNIFRVMASHPELALYGMAKIGGNIATSGYTLDLWGDQLILQSLVRPQDLAERDELPSVPTSGKLASMATELMETMLAPLDIGVFDDTRKSKLDTILASKAGTEVAPAEAPPVEVDDLVASLEKALQAAARKKAA
jgi:hypothetical protein